MSAAGNKVTAPASTTTIQPGQSGYPAGLSRYLDKGTLPAVTVWGNGPLPRPTLALLCSATAPAGILLAVHDLAQQWRQGQVAIVSGFHSPVEKEAYHVLLRGPAPVIRCPARSLEGMRLFWGDKMALNAGYLWLVSPFPEKVRRATEETALERNRFVAALADQVLVAHARPGSKTEQLVEEVMGWSERPVWTLEHEANGNLVAMGARVRR